MTLNNFIAENIFLPLGDFLSGNKVSKYLKFLLKSQYWTQEQIENYQNIRLRKLIEYAYNNVPFYKSIFKQNKLSVDDIKTKNDLAKLPILTKKIIRAAGSEIQSINFPKNMTINSGSSGSTGEPLFFLLSKEAYSLNLAANLRGWYWMGFKLGDKYIKISQNPRINKLKNIQDIVSRNKYLSINPMVDSNFKYILDIIEKYKPKVIRSYPDPLFFLAEYKEKHKEYKYVPSSITTTGNTLFPETREFIEKVFNCPVFDAYSCEGTPNVFECSTHDFYHITDEYAITEVLDENNNIINNGIGRLISTDLWNFAQPFIRYDTQDIVEVSSVPCKCGRNLKRIKRILGRDNDIIIAPNGRKFIVHNFTGFFQRDDKHLKRSIESFQVRKKGNIITILLIVNDNYDKSVNEYIRNYWANEMNMNVVIKEVDEIPLTKSGKRRFIINED